eukprot:5265271-Amphidinium_carterae.1
MLSITRLPKDIASAFAPLLLDFTGLYFGCLASDTAFAHYAGSLLAPLVFMLVVLAVSVFYSKACTRRGSTMYYWHVGQTRMSWFSCDLVQMPIHSTLGVCDFG